MVTAIIVIIISWGLINMKYVELQKISYKIVTLFKEIRLEYIL